jgi:DNA-directed RNA polymerase specialized sigma24 family protein
VDADAFGRALSPLLTPAYRLAFGLCMDAAAAEDAVVSAAEKAHGARGRLRPGSSLWRWFAGIVKREARPVELAVMLPTATHDPELRRLRRLSFEDRSVLLLHYYADLSIEELAAVERLSTVEVSARLALARERLRPLLTDVDAVGPLDDDSLANRLRALAGGLGDPGPDFQQRVADAVAWGFRKTAYRRPVLALVAAILVLAAIALVSSGLRTVGWLPPHKPVAAAQLRLYINQGAGEGRPTPAHSTSQPPPAGGLALSDATLPGGEVGAGWPGASYAVSGGTPPYRWSVAPANPFGLAVDPGGNSLTISGSPTASGSTPVTITVTDSAGLSQNRTYILTIASTPAISGPLMVEAI